jgi:hypothetical protein
MVAIMHNKRPPTPTHESFTDGLRELMQRCWDQKRHNRPQTLEVLLVLNSAMPSPTPLCMSLITDIYRQLGGPSPPADTFRPLLFELLSHPDLELHIRGLQGSDLQEFVDLLDKVGKDDIKIQRR